MTVRVAFIAPRGVNSLGVQVLAGARAFENVTVGNSATNVAQAREVALVLNEETSTVMVATGTTPDAATTTATSASSAGVPVPAGQSVVLALNTGDKVNVKAAS